MRLLQKIPKECNHTVSKIPENETLIHMIIIISFKKNVTLQHLTTCYG